MENYEYSKKLKISFIFLALSIFTILLILTFVGINNSDIKNIVTDKNETYLSTRGTIYTFDNYTLAYSKKVWQVKLYKTHLNPNKIEFILDLLSKYNSIDKETLRDRLLTDSSSVILFEDIDELKVKDIRNLSRIFNREGVFVPEKNGFCMGLDVEIKKPKRIYPFNDTLEPYLGYVKQQKYGLESYYDKLLTKTQDEILKGKKDKNGVIIRDNKQSIEEKENGFSIVTNIYMELQKNLEYILSKQKDELEAKEVIAAIMNSETGKIIAVGSSRRYNPDKIRDVNATTISAIRYIYEPGSVIKPIFFTTLLENNQVNIEEIINTHNGFIRLSNGKRVTDEHHYPFLSAKDVIVHSSNVGMVELSKRANPLKTVDGFRKFGFAQRSGIDLSYELSGTIPGVVDLKNSVVIANLSYGYAIRVNFFQLLKAYNVFNNHGTIVTPRIAHIKINSKGEKELIDSVRVKKILSDKVVNTMHSILKQVVERGTAQATKIDGLEIGGKTGTAQITEHGHYVSRYNSSFFGFANGKKNKFTIGVLVIEPKYSKHFASQSAVPTFRKIVEELVREKFLKPINFSRK